MLAVPNVNEPAVCALVMKLPDSGGVAVTALNYRRERVSVDVDLFDLPGVPPDQLRGKNAHDIIAGQDAGQVSNGGRLRLDLEGSPAEPWCSAAAPQSLHPASSDAFRGANAAGGGEATEARRYTLIERPNLALL